MANNLKLYALIFLVSLLVACGQAETNETVVIVTAVPVSPTSLSLSPTHTPTPSATATTIPTQTQTPSATATATTILTLTPLPTFAPEELETAVADLLANPMNCEVPCWWGAIPGETTFFEINQFLELHHLTDYIRYLDQESPNDRFELGIGFDENTNTYNFRVRYGFTDNVLTSLISEHAPPISNVLEKYGQPDEIWLETMSFELETLPVRLNMVYLQEGLATGYVVDGDIQDDMAIGCFSDEIGIVILKTPHSVTKHTDFFTLFEEDRLYLPLEEASDLTMGKFMQQFSDPNQPQCIETPTELWE